MNIFNEIINAYQNNLPFVAYRKPNTTTIKGVFLQNNTLFYTQNYTESGFVFAPFDDKYPSVLFPFTKAKRLEETFISTKIISEKNDFPFDDDSKENHINLIKRGLETIEKGQFKKVVLSRKEDVKLIDFDIFTTFKKLLQNYTNAFVYVWYHPKVGLWLGATPETLLQVQNNQFTTMALAGTQVYKGTTDVVWQEKELQEQQFVTDFIINNLEKVTKNLQKSTVKTVKAGNLVHLKTVITGNLEQQELKNIINVLHPTPAVCGLPKEQAKAFILANENYKRGYYTGFLGELNINTSTSLFVNLRCMNIDKNKATIYVGGGITKDSNPEKEYEETVAKSKTMKRVLT